MMNVDKEETIKVKDTVIEPPNMLFRIELENRREGLARVSKTMRKHFIRLLPGDCVMVALSPDDLNRGSILHRS